VSKNEAQGTFLIAITKKQNPIKLLKQALNQNGKGHNIA
jgi:hypothetical protein